MGLYTKIHAVMVDSEGLDKEMTIGSGSFSYKAISEASVLNLIKPLLKKHGLVIFPVGVQVIDRIDTFNTPKGESNRMMTQVIAKYKIVDIETGESEILETVGNGVDTQDKASGKALTYGYKALMQKTFCLFSGEDTENEHSDTITDRQTKPTATPKSAYTKQEKKVEPTVTCITENQAVEVANECAELDSDIKKVMQYFKLATLDKMTTTQFVEFKEMMVKKREQKEPTT